MTHLTIDLEVLRHNLTVINKWMDQHGSSWTVVTKVLCGHADTLRALQLLGVRSIGDSRLRNLRTLDRLIPDFEAWYLRVPAPSTIPDVITYADGSLNSEIEIIRELNEEALRQNRLHRIIIMIELGDLREGILPGSLMRFYERIFELPNIEVLGIGANLGCLAGAMPSIDQFMQLILYRELLELKFERKLPLISAGSTVVLPMLLEGQLPKAINHFRIGEALFLGTNLVQGGTLPELRNDVVILEAEIAEIKRKSLTPLVETGTATPFADSAEEAPSPGQRGYRALISLGQLDTDIGGLTPMHPEYTIAGASSDIAVINLGEDQRGLKVGDTLRFRVDYAALLRLMSSPYVDKRIQPALGEFGEQLHSHDESVDPVMPQVSDREVEPQPSTPEPSTEGR